MDRSARLNELFAVAHTAPEGALERVANSHYPIVCRNAAVDWPASQRWSREFFAETYGNESVVAHGLFSNREQRLSLKHYLQLQGRRTTPEPLMLHWQIGKHLGLLWRDLYVPGSLQSWLSSLDSSLDPHWRWIVYGPAGGGTLLHCDIAGTAAWNVLLQGRKSWVFISPNGRVASSDILGTDFSKLEEPPLVLSQEPGDVVYVPSGWWHQVFYEVFSIAATENVLIKSCAAAVVQSLEASGMDTWVEIVTRLGDRFAGGLEQ